MNTIFPPEAICDVVNCGHRNDEHQFAQGFQVGEIVCESCRTNAKRGFNDIKPFHEFQPRRFAGGAYSPNAEREAYQRVMRGE